MYTLMMATLCSWNMQLQFVLAAVKLYIDGLYCLFLCVLEAHQGYHTLNVCVYVYVYVHSHTHTHTHTHTHIHTHPCSCVPILYVHEFILVWRMDGEITDRENQNTWIKMCCSAISPQQILHWLLWSCSWTPSEKPVATCVSYGMPLPMPFNPSTT